MDSTLEVYYNKAEDLYKNKNYDESLNQIQKAIELENSCVKCWILVCKIYLDLKKFQEASSSIFTALNFDSRSHEAWYLRSKILIGLMRYDEALLACNKALDLDKNNQNYLKLKDNISNFIKIRSEENYFSQDTKPQSPNGENQQNSSVNTNVNNSPKTEVETNNTASNNVDSDFFKFNPSNKYSNIIRVTNLKNIDLFKQKKLNSKVYYNMLDDVMSVPIININKSNKNIFNKIKDLASYYTTIEYKAEGEELGLYTCNIIRIDTRSKTIEQIITFIHELTHHLLSEIFELALMYLFDSVKTDAIEAFAWYCLNFKDEYVLMNEYCAHAVENYFMPYPYNNFESFNNVLTRFDLNNSEDIKKINFATKLGNTFSQDIIYMLNKYIDDTLKKEIKKQYLVDGFMLYLFKGTEFKTKEFFNDTSKFNYINQIFIETTIHVNTHFKILELMNYKREFAKANRRKKSY